MLAPRASSAFVCLRCELKLARPRVAFLSRRNPHATFSSSAVRHDAFDETGPETAPRPRAQLTAHPLGKLRKGKGRAVVRESTARLAGVKTLGNDAEILVLQEVGDARQDEKTPTPSLQQSPEDTKQQSILASLQAEATKVGQEEINLQLQSLRPRNHSDPDGPHYIAQTEFMKLNKTLSKGFTVQQLSRYFSDAKGVEQASVKKEILDGFKKGTRKSQIARTQWQPGTTPLGRRLPGVDMSKGAKRAPISKNLLVDQILRNVWNLVLLEEIEAPGELEIALKPWQLVLLNAGANPTALDRIGSERKAKIEIFWPRNVLRITADKSSAEYAADDIQERLASTEALKFHMIPWLQFISEDQVPEDKLTALFSFESLQAVGKVSQTVIQVVSANQLVIRGLTKTSIDEARRGVIRLLPLKPSYTRTVEDCVLVAKKEDSYVLPATAKSSLDHRLRSLDLGRWTRPITRLPDVEGKEYPSEEGNLRRRLLRSLREIAKASLPSGGFATELTCGATWNEHADAKLTAEFGHTLVPPQGTSQSPYELSVGPFSYTVPGISRVVADHEILDAHHSPPTLQYEFVPSPSQQPPPQRGEEYPRLLMHFRTDHEPELAYVAIHFDEHYHDVVLPNQVTDIRFKKYMRLRLLNPHEVPAIQEFAQAVRTNIKSGARLSAPPSITLEIPRRSILGSTSRSSGARSVTYLFSDVKHREFRNMAMDDFTLSYNTVQAGQLGAKDSSLSALFRPPTTSQPPYTLVDHERVRSFVDTSLKLVDILAGLAAATKPMSRVVRARDPQSARKMKRGELAMQLDEGEQTEAGLAMGDVSGSSQHQNSTSDPNDVESSPLLSIDDIDDPILADCFRVEGLSEEEETFKSRTQSAAIVEEHDDELPLNLLDSESVAEEEPQDSAGRDGRKRILMSPA